MRANEDRDALIEAELDRLFGDAPCQLSRRRVCEVLGFFSYVSGLGWGWVTILGTPGAVRS